MSPQPSGPFVSYSRVDAAFAMQLAEDLKAQGADVWLDQLSIDPGTQWDQAVEIALKSAPCVLLILSPASVKSKNVMDEINFALEENKILIPVWYQHCEVPWRLRRIQRIDFRTDYARGLKTLVAHLGAGSSGQTASVATPGVSSDDGPNAGMDTKSPSVAWFWRQSRLAVAGLTAIPLLAVAAIWFSVRPPHLPSSTQTSEYKPPEADSIPLAGSQKGFTPPELARLYNFPANLDGAGQTIALIELGGGYRNEDLQQYFKQLKLHLPNVSSIDVDGGGNHPTTASSADSQVVKDIEIAGAIAPKAKIVVYFTGNTDQGFIDAIREASHNEENPTTVMLICWGSAEKSYTASSVQAFNAAFEDAVRQGITTVVAAGDNGITDGEKGARVVDFPASSPWVLAVGGTSVSAQNGNIYTETVWNNGGSNGSATGGGVSTVFPQPQWQQAAHIPPLFGVSGRGVPDVTASADPRSGYIVRVDGQTQVSGGTGSSAPLWAGLIALLNQGLGRNLGYLNPALYQSVGPSGAFNDILKGTNSVSGVKGCTAGPGWDYCSGWGSPNGVKLLEAFRAAHP